MPGVSAALLEALLEARNAPARTPFFPPVPPAIPNRSAPYTTAAAATRSGRRWPRGVRKVRDGLAGLDVAVRPWMTTRLSKLQYSRGMGCLQ